MIINSDQNSHKIIETGTVTDLTSEEKEDPLSFKQNLTEFFIRNNNKDVIATFENWDKRSKYGLHANLVTLNFSLQDDISKEEILSKLALYGYGTAELVEVNKNNYKYSLFIKDVTGHVTVSIGDIGPITFEKMPLLEWTLERNETLETSLWTKPDYEGEIGVSSALYIPKESDGEIIISFTEEMDPFYDFAAFSSAEKIVGEWISPTQYQIDIAQFEHQASVRFSGNWNERVFSKSGNYLLEGSNNWIDLIKVPEYQWINFTTGNEVGWSRRDRFYDHLIFSPDQNNYVGVLNRGIGPGSGDSDGLYYDYVLEKEGNKYQIFEEGLYTSVRQDGAPVQWMDNNRILYASNNDVFIFNTNTGENIKIFSTHGENNLHQVTYDPYVDQFYILTYTYTDEIGHFLTDKWVLEGDGRIIDHTEEYSEGMDSSKYTPNYLSIHPTEDGVFWTYLDGEEYSTKFESREGTSFSLKGEVIMVVGDTIYLEEKGSPVKDYPKFFIWQSTYDSPKEIPTSPGPIVRPVGKYLISLNQETFDYYWFDHNAWEWKYLFNENEIVAFPIQTTASIYKRK